MNEAGQLSGGPTHTTIRRIDQLIPVDDISQLRSVQAMLEDARLTATTVGSIPYSSPQSSPPDSDLQTHTPAPIPPTQIHASQTLAHRPVTQTGNRDPTMAHC